MRDPSLFLTCAAAGLVLLAGSICAAPPSVFMANPRGDAVVNIGDNVYLRANASDPGDPGGQVTQVDFYTNGVLLGSAAAAPFAVWWTNAVGTNIAVTAIAIDNSLERSTSFLVRVTAEPPRPRDLSWTLSTSPAGEAQWNTRDFRWYETQTGGGRLALFHPGDGVAIYSWDPVFIGVDGVPVPVSPRATGSGYVMMLHGADILTGSLTVSGGALLTNYAGSLSFPGGTVVRQFSSGLAYNIARAPQGASVHLGTGPITVIESKFQFELMTNQFAMLENDFYFETTTTASYQSSLRPAPFYSANATAKFTGALNLNGRLNVMMGNGTQNFSIEGRRDADYHEWAGPIILSQVRNVQTGFFLEGQYRSKGLLLSGDIKDGGGAFSNRLVLQGYGVPVLRLTGSNTYARGTLIDAPTGGPPTWMEVAPQSSLGRGDVEVRGVLRLMGNQNINSNATVHLQQGRVIIDTGVKVRVSRLLLGAISYTAGIFSGTNSFGRITSNGTIRVPAVNIPPTVTLTTPKTGSALGAADSFEIQAEATDQDSYMERVEFYLDGAPIGTRTNPPFHLSVSGTTVGQHTLWAMAYDDDGGIDSSELVTITVAPSIDAIRHLGTNVVVIEFRAPSGQTLLLDATDSLSAPMWSPVGSFAGAAPHSVTNTLPAGLSTRYYRLRTLGNN
jgi:hypothetical protein